MTDDELMKLTLKYANSHSEKFGFKIRGNKEDIKRDENGWAFIYLDAVPSSNPIRATDHASVMMKCEANLIDHLIRDGHKGNILIFPMEAKDED